jgi:hypothetical protein
MRWCRSKKPANDCVHHSLLRPVATGACLDTTRQQKESSVYQAVIGLSPTSYCASRSPGTEEFWPTPDKVARRQAALATRRRSWADVSVG